MKTEPKTYRRSRQRERILQLLRQTDAHPTADWVYENLKKEFPRLSLGTVYRNLGILVDQGVIHKIRSGSTFDRFEAKNTVHYHLICERCGKIADFNMPIHDELEEQASRMTDFLIQKHRIDFFGLCGQCRKIE
ncbi:MAG TPA: transcriptional repressor [bacterium]|nr:transcriptional repressor [bacterium]